MINIKILVATHKAYWMPDDSVYRPLQVGAALHPDLGYMRDDMGDNISAKNPNYCELTGLYWAWKNFKSDYIGLCHYRRYFGHHRFFFSVDRKKESIFKRADYESLLQKYDIILPKPLILYENSVREQYESSHYKKDLDKTEKIILEKYPEFHDAFKKVMDQHQMYTFNMFVMKKELFDKYCLWLFDILFTLEKRIDIKSYDSYQARIFGFLSERLFNIWLDKQQLAIVEVPTLFIEKVPWKEECLDFARKVYHTIKWRILR